MIPFSWSWKEAESILEKVTLGLRAGAQVGTKTHRGAQGENILGRRSWFVCTFRGQKGGDRVRLLGNEKSSLELEKFKYRHGKINDETGELSQVRS